MRTYGCRSCVTRFSVKKEGAPHTTHASRCPFCGSGAIQDLAVKAAATDFARVEKRSRQLTGAEL